MKSNGKKTSNNIQIIDLVKKGKIPTASELDQLNRLLDAFQRDYDNTPSTITGKASGKSNSAPLRKIIYCGDDDDLPKKQPSPTPQEISMREAYLKIDHLNNDLYDKRCKATESYSERQKLFDDMLDKYKKSIYHFTQNHDADVNRAVKHISEFVQRIKEDRERILYFGDIESEFYEKTNTSLSDLEKKLNYIVSTFNSSEELITLQGTAYNAREIARAEFICSTSDFLKSEKYITCKNGFACLSHYKDILEKERIYYQILSGGTVLSSKLNTDYSNNKPSEAMPKVCTVTSIILSLLSLQISMEFFEELQLLLNLAVILGIFFVFLILPLTVRGIRESRRTSRYLKHQEEFATGYARQMREYIEEIPTSDSDIKYVSRVGATAHKMLEYLAEFLEFSKRYCGMPRGISEYSLMFYREYFKYSSSVQEAERKYYEERKRRWQREEEKRKQAEEEKFKKDILDAIESAEKDKNIALALALLHAQNANDPSLALDKDRQALMKKATDYLNKKY